MSAFDQVMRAEARLIMLRSLDAEAAGRLNSEILRLHLDSFGIPRSRDWVHEELRWLAEIGAVTLADAGSVRVASLTLKGRDHVERRLVLEGVKRPSPET